jgi:uncharacterized protein YbaR (Trm112 family)
MGRGFEKEPILTKERSMTINPELLDILACPKCKGEIHLNENKDGLVCEACRLVYEIRDDIPIMLIDEAKPLA